MRPDWLEYHEEPVQLHSGGWSHWLVRGDLMFANEPLREAVLSYWLDILRSWKPPLRILSIPTGGDRWANALKECIEPLVSDETPFMVVVDDVVTTGASMDAAVAHLHLAVVDRRVGGTRLQPHVAAWATLQLPVFKEKPVS